ncbi:MAG: 16S rRNA (guanine(527)-N(7))-methyltransferase RsmG [Litorivicinus sp.]
MDIVTGAQHLGIELDHAQVQQLERFLDGVEKWSRVYNLTRITNRSQMVTHHLLDSLSLAEFLTDEPLLDVGSGAGFPGVPLAIARPFHDITVLDAAQKRTRFAIQMKGELALENLSVVTARVESYQTEHLFKQVTARAFAPLQDLCQWVQPLLAPGAKVLALKGQYPTSEIEQTRALFPSAQVDSSALDVPGVEAQRHLIEVQF